MFAALHAGKRRQRSPQPLPELPVEPARGHRARRPRKRLWRHHGACGRLGAKRRRVGDHPPLQTLRSAQLQPRGGGRQPNETHEHRHAAAQRAAVPPRANRGDDRPHGRRGEAPVKGKQQKITQQKMRLAKQAAFFGTPDQTLTGGLPLRSHLFRFMPCSALCFKMPANPYEYRTF